MLKNSFPMLHTFKDAFLRKVFTSFFKNYTGKPYFIYFTANGAENKASVYKSRGLVRSLLFMLPFQGACLMLTLYPGRSVVAKAMTGQVSWAKLYRPLFCY
jgi:hypothetical protein